MSDGVLNRPEGGARVLINLVGLKVNAVRFYRMPVTREVRLVSSLGHNVALVWECETAEQALGQAEMLWDKSIPARIVTDEVSESSFIDGLTGGKEDGV